MSDNVLVLGANSGIAKALCRVLAERRCGLVLAGRNNDELEKSVADLQLRYQGKVFAEPFDALDFEGHPEFFERCVRRFGGNLDGIVLCHGYLPDQERTQTDFAEARRTIDVNFTSAVCLLNLGANYLESRRRGYIVAIASVAGDRGRQSNYTYGTAKAGLATYLQGLRNRLNSFGIHVLTVKPGFVDTPMLRGNVNPNSLLVAAPERVAMDIDRAIRKRKNVLYTPWFWRFIMRTICLIPEQFFKRLRL